MKKCAHCGKAIKQHYELCYDCMVKDQERREYERYRNMSEDEKEAEREEYYNTECVMCGKEGASERSDGKCYCSMCWTVWNS